MTSLRQELERDRLSELQVFGSIDFAHAAAAQQADDAVAAGQHRAGNELRAVERVRRRQPIGSSATVSVGACDASTRAPQAGQ